MMRGRAPCNSPGNELQQGRRVADVFSLQTRMIEQLSRVLGQPDHGRVPPLPEANRAEHRVFKAQLAQPPRMWLTHPPSSEREDNCKRRYIAAAIDERSAWVLFDDEPALRKRLSEHLFRTDKPVDAVPHRGLAQASRLGVRQAFAEPRLPRLLSGSSRRETRVELGRAVWRGAWARVAARRVAVAVPRIARRRCRAPARARKKNARPFRRFRVVRSRRPTASSAIVDGS